MVFGIIFGVLLIIVLLGLVTVNQGSVAVITIFGKYRRILRPGLSVRIPLIEKIYKRISIQNRSMELQFQAITQDQANVNFSAMMLYSVLNHDDITIQNVAFKFVDDRNFMQALVRSVEGSVRAFVATKRQSEILQQRIEIIQHVKEQLDQQLEEWGFHLLDLQINDITFDEVIMRSMAQVVASNNLKAAAENEGQALLITKTKAAEADGNAIKISAEAEKLAGVWHTPHVKWNRPIWTLRLSSSPCGRMPSNTLRKTEKETRYSSMAPTTACNAPCNKCNPS
jgi:regulator of protease activity HflC (stomatin/prohibitin superfamily)